MKRVTYVVTPQEEYFDPTETRWRDRGVTLEAIHDVDVLADGTITVFLEVSGAPAQIRASFDQTLPRLHDSEVIVTPEATMVQLRYQPTAFNRAILEPHRNYGVIVEYPMRFVDPDRSSLRVTVAGPMADVQQLVDETRELAELTVENVTRYDPTSNPPYHDLTAHQREVLQTAHEHGYYEVPREATYSDIAAELDCSASAVGQTLRRIESALVGATVSSTLAGREREV
ncbi:helix-turn-helix domain-containing protein [Natrialba hulunbeirensis]|nr:helix-turn-helix domain-containing protein [Natrialba hulunbeirensis]